jgi:hypothetical protein
MALYLVREREYQVLRRSQRGVRPGYGPWRTIKAYADILEAEEERGARKTGLFQRVVTLRGQVVVDAEGHRTGQATPEPFCACGRRISQCDGSRAGCRQPQLR